MYSRKSENVYEKDKADNKIDNIKELKSFYGQKNTGKEKGAKKKFQSKRGHFQKEND